jgi:hypothetical protein
MGHGRQSEQEQPKPVQYLKLANEYDVGSTLQDARTEVAICSEERGKQSVSLIARVRCSTKRVMTTLPFL